jgi:hypothetical protein
MSLERALKSSFGDLRHINEADFVDEMEMRLTVMAIAVSLLPFSKTQAM